MTTPNPSGYPQHGQQPGNPSQPGYPAAPQQGYPSQPNYPPQPGNPSQPGYPGQPAAGQPQPGAVPQPPQPGAYNPASPQSGFPQAQTGQGIALTTKFFPMAWLFFFIKPTILVNGQQLPNGQWGRNEIPLAAGQYNLHVHVPYFLPPKVGEADLNVTLHPGQPVELEYRAPLWAFSRGSLGMPPQSYNGLGAMIALTAIIIVLVFLIALIPLLAAA